MWFPLYKNIAKSRKVWLYWGTGFVAILTETALYSDITKVAFMLYNAGKASKDVFIWLIYIFI